MKKLIAVAILIIASLTTAQVNAQTSDGFNIDVFQKALIEEMTIQFPGFKLDTTLNYILRAKSQEEAGYPAAYVMKNGGNANIQKDEKEEAKRVVTEYREKLAGRTFTYNDLVRCHFTEFSALATKVNGSVRYALIVDNNFTYESLEVIADEFEQLDSTLQAKFDSIMSVSSKIQSEFPTWKTGDDNSQLRGLLRNIATDPIPKHLFLIDSSVSQLHINGFNSIHSRVTLDTWLSTLDPNLYTSDEFTIKYNSDGEIEHLYIFNSDNQIIREIMIIWDKSYDGRNYSNLRTIMDSYFNQ